MIDLLLEPGADVHAPAATRVIPSPLGVVTLGGETPLHDAAASECTECVARLLTHGADIHATDARDVTPFQWAVDSGHHGAVELLLDAGVDVNQGKDPGIALHLAAYKGNPKMAELLLRHGASVNLARRDGATALFRCVSYPEGSDAVEPMTADRLATVRLLLANGAEVQTRGFLGDSPLHRAAAQGYAPAAGLLIDHGADLNARDTRNNTLMYYAWSGGVSERVKECLRRHGGTGAFGEPR